METEGIVSVWVGTAVSLEEAQNAIRYQYTEDGDVIESWFTKHFNIFYYDEDFAELLYNDGETRTIEETLRDASYAQSYMDSATRAAREKGLGIIELAYLVFRACLLFQSSRGLPDHARLGEAASEQPN